MHRAFRQLSDLCTTAKWCLRGVLRSNRGDMDYYIILGGAVKRENAKIWVFRKRNAVSAVKM